MWTSYKLQLVVRETNSVSHNVPFGKEKVDIHPSLFMFLPFVLIFAAFFVSVSGWECNVFFPLKTMSELNTHIYEKSCLAKTT